MSKSGYIVPIPHTDTLSSSNENWRESDAQRRARRINLNTATREEIEAIPMISPELAQALVALRPFRGWEDLTRVQGFYLALIEDLCRAGVELS